MPGSPPGQPAGRHPAFQRRDIQPASTRIAVLAIAFLAILPMAALIYRSFGDSQGVWPHLIAHVLPVSAVTTIILLTGVAAGTLVIGTLTAWVVTRYRFPMSGVLQWALVLPLATPTYLAAYTWVEFSDFTGPLQHLVREVGGFSSARDYWFPDIRSTGGAIFLLSMVLFPYVYLPARLSFALQGQSMLDVARVLGAGPAKLFLRVALPSARPAVAIGVVLALMETLNDIGAVEYLGVRTVTFSVFDTWLNRSSLAGAAQLSLALLAFVALLVYAERRLRRQQAYFDLRQGRHGFEPARLSGWRACTATTLCALPILLGFGVPLIEMVDAIVTYPEQMLRPELARATLNSVMVATGTALACITAGFILVHARRAYPSRIVRNASLMAGFGYAVPGTVLAIGVLTALTGFDNQISRFWQSLGGERTGLILSGSMAIIIFACSVRFLTVAIGNIEAGFSRLSPSLVAAARTLGRSGQQAVLQVELPLLARTLAITALLIIVETMKELSATIMLRPFNFDTLATHVYSQASRALFEQAAFAALLIVLIGLVPVYLLTRMFISEKGEDGAGKKNADLGGPQ